MFRGFRVVPMTTHKRAVTCRNVSSLDVSTELARSSLIMVFVATPVGVIGIVMPNVGMS